MRRNPLVGRQTAVRALSDRVRDGQGVVVRGPSGIGKTRLVAEVLEGLDGSRQVDRLLASPTTAGRALSAVAPLVGPGRGHLPLPDVHAWLVGRWERRAARAGPALLWLDDAQHVDAVSAQVVRHAVTIGVVQPVATHRTPEPLPTDLQVLLDETALQPVDVEPLEPVEILELAQQVTGRSLADDDARRLVELSAGNPLYARELAAVIASGESPDAWRTLDGLVGHQVAALDPERRRVVELVAVAEPLPAALLGPEAGFVDGLVLEGLLQHQGEGLLRVDHPVRSAWVVNRLGPLVPLVLDELLQRADRLDLHDELDPVSVADWSLAAGRPTSQALAVTATRLALARSDASTALRLVEAVREPQRSLLHGQALLSAGDLPGGLAVLDRVRRDHPAAEQAEAAAWQARYLGVMLGDFEAGHRLLAPFVAGAVDTRLEKLLWITRAWLWVLGPGPDEPSLAEAVRAGRRPPLDDASYDLLVTISGVAVQTQGPAECAGIFRQAERLADSVEVGSAARGRADVAASAFDMAMGRPTAGGAALMRALQGAVRRGDPETAVLVGISTGIVLGATGQVREARAAADAALGMPASGGWLGYRLMMAAVDLGNRCLDGHPQGVAERLSAARSGWPSGTDPPAFFDLFAARAGRLARATGGHVAEVAELRRALARAAEHRKNLYAALVAGELLDLRDPPELHALTLDLCRAVPSCPLVAVTARLASARLAGGAEQVLHAGLELEHMGLVTAASHAAADALRLPHDDSTGRLALRSCVRLRHAWSGGHMWWLDDLADLPTEHQVDVAVRVAETGSVRRVAEELTLSRRTVENHLYRVTHALGVGGQQGLLEALRPVE